LRRGKVVNWDETNRIGNVILPECLDPLMRVFNLEVGTPLAHDCCNTGTSCYQKLMILAEAVARRGGSKKHYSPGAGR